MAWPGQGWFSQSVPDDLLGHFPKEGEVQRLTLVYHKTPTGVRVRVLHKASNAGQDTNDEEADDDGDW